MNNANSKTTSDHCNVVVLISGRGSNLRALHEGAKNFTISAVISDNASAGGVTYAKQTGIPVTTLPKVPPSQREQYTAELIKSIKAYRPTWIALAGFMQIIRPALLEEFEDQVINIHPALLPAFPGLNTHARALAAGVREHGCTVHLVDSGVDTGPIIAQASVPITEGLSVDELAAHVLDCEHMLYPWVVNNLAAGAISIYNANVRYNQKVQQEAKTRGIRLAH